jgi:hypothetical protein
MSWFAVPATSVADRRAQVLTLARASLAFFARTALFAASVGLLWLVKDMARDSGTRGSILLACIAGVLGSAIVARRHRTLGWVSGLACTCVALATVAEGAFASAAWLSIGAVLELSIGAIVRSLRGGAS